MSRHIEVASLLIDLEAQLRQLNLWSRELPSEQALASTEPFCIDTLSFPEWLQFVFIERINLLIEQDLPLPTNCQIAPMGEEYFRGTGLMISDLQKVLTALDQTLS